jgi:hypothetical protein
MAINLGASAGIRQGVFFSPEEQLRMQEVGVNGIDVTHGLRTRVEPVITSEMFEELQRLQNISSMVDSGDLVPKDIAYQQYQSQNQNNQPQQASVRQNDYNGYSNQNTENNQERDWMDILGIKDVGSSFQESNQQPSNVPNTVQNEQPAIQWEDVIRDQRNALLNESARHGIKGDEIIEWMSSLKPENYVQLFKNSTQSQNDNYNQNQSQWNEQQIVPSIGDMPNAYVQRTKPDPQWAAFGIDPNNY